MWDMFAWLLVLTLGFLSVQADGSVHVLSENLGQYITSTTLEWLPSTGNDDSLLAKAVIAAYQSVKEPKQNEPSEDDSLEEHDIVNKPVYVCRAKINSVSVSGQLRPTKPVCIVSLYKKVSEYKQFDILVSIEDSSRLSWVHKNKYTLISQGAVTSGDNILKSYIARRTTKSHNKDGSLTHIVGKYTPSENLGVFHLVDQNNNELQFEDGEILVETEPVRYEFNSIRLERHRGRSPRTRKLLGEAVLKNEEDGLQHVASVISYKYNYTLYWGKGHGLLTGLPFTVTLANGTKIQGEWAVPHEEEKSDVAPVEMYLETGTAVNVTLYGNYTESEIPYNASIVAVYKDGEKRELMIRDTKREHTISEVVAVYSPVYFLHNNSYVPTTTTTTAATTSRVTSTTSKTTSTTQEMPPIPPPNVVLSPGDDKHPDSQNDENWLANGESQHKNQAPTRKPEASTTPNASGLVLVSSVTILSISVLILRVT